MTRAAFQPQVRSLIPCTLLCASLLTAFAPAHRQAAAQDLQHTDLRPQVEFVVDGPLDPVPEAEQDPSRPSRDLALVDTTMASASIVFGQESARPAGQPEPLHWKAGDVILEPGLAPELRAFRAQTSPWVYVLVQYRWEPAPQQAAEVLAWGYQELDYIPQDGFIARVPAARLDALAAQPFVHAVAPLRPEWKLAPSLKETMAQGHDATLAVLLAAFEPPDLAVGGPLVRVGDSRFYEGRLNASQIRAYAGDSLVQWIEPLPEGRLSLATSVPVMAVDNVQQFGHLRGSGVRVAVLDTGIDTGHPHFSGVNFILGRDFADGDNSPTDNCNGHGLFVAGTIAGQGTFQGQRLTGVAPGATIIVERVSDCDGRSELARQKDWFDQAAGLGARVISSSWGTPSGGAYGALASNTDAWARDHENTLMVFSNGNYPDAQSVDTPGIAKNVIAVGASVDGSPADGGPPNAETAFKVDQVSILNNLLLPSDDRVKPDLNAPGTRITAPFLNDDYLTARGSSASAPHVSGVLALYLEKYPARRADEIKAALINSAVDLSRKDDQTAYPQGWGRATAYDFIYETSGEALDGNFRGEVGDLAPHAVAQALPIPVPGNARYLKVTMTYLDRPAAMNASPALVNDIDMRLQSPSGVSYVYPGRRIDNVEQIMRVNPEAGTWKLYMEVVKIPGITETSQKFGGNITIVTGQTDLKASLAEPVVGSLDSPFDLAVKLTTSGWFAYGVYATVEVLDPALQLAPGSTSGFVPGDMWLESHTWRPSLVASSCGTFPNALRLTVGATNVNTSSRLLDVKVACATYTIAGYIRTSSGSPIPGVTMQGLPGNPVTDTQGYYRAQVPEGWSGTVTPQKPGFVFDPPSMTYTDVTSGEEADGYEAAPSFPAYLPLVVGNGGD